MRLRDPCGSPTADDDLRLPRRIASERDRSLRNDGLALARNQSLVHRHTAINPPATADRSHLDQLLLAELGWAHKNRSHPASPPHPSPCVRGDAFPPPHQGTALPSPPDYAPPYATEPHPDSLHLPPRP